jgi:hypothetical protein
VSFWQRVEDQLFKFPASGHYQLMMPPRAPPPHPWSGFVALSPALRRLCELHPQPGPGPNPAATIVR